MFYKKVSNYPLVITKLNEIRGEVWIFKQQIFFVSINPCNNFFAALNPCKLHINIVFSMYMKKVCTHPPLTKMNISVRLYEEH